ncbi:MAG: DUF58 domain-containing protein [Granulosicoccus sp.]
MQRIFRTRAEDSLPLAIEHQRIYILPTRRGWAFLLVLLLMLVASVNYALSLGYALCFLLTGLFSATLLHTYRNLAGIELRQIRSGTAYAGEPLGFTLHLFNNSKLARSGLRICARNVDQQHEMEEESSVTASMDLPAQTMTLTSLDIPTTRRGPQVLGRLTLQSDWPLGLWTTWSYVHTPLYGLVFPQPEADAPALPCINAEGVGTRNRDAINGDVAGLREYQVGDPLTAIAWKSAARGLGLHVRTFDDETGPGITRLTLGSTQLSDTEARLSRLAAWILEAEQRNAYYSLELPGIHLPLAQGPVHQDAALGACALHGKDSS